MAQLSMEPRRWVLRALIISLAVGCVSAPPKLTEEQYNATFPPEGLDADALSDSESEDTDEHQSLWSVGARPEHARVRVSWIRDPP